jgi:hypothetical protein
VSSKGAAIDAPAKAAAEGVPAKRTAMEGTASTLRPALSKPLLLVFFTV